MSAHSPQIDQMIDDFINGTIDPERALLLKESLKRDEVVRIAYVKRLDQEALIAERFSNQPSSIPLDGLIHPVPSSARTTGSTRRMLGLLISSAMTLAILTGVMIGGAQVYNHFFAPQANYISATDDVKLKELTDGELVRQGLKRGEWLEVIQGIVTIRFRNGADVSLQGPARFRVDHAERGYLQYGTLTALVPPESQGFIIQTDSMELIDWGTEFLIEAKAEQQSTAIVRTGRCGGRPVVNGRPQGAYQEMTAGNALVFQFSRSAPQGGKPPRDWIPANRQEAFNDFDRQLSGVTHHEGNVMVLNSLPGGGDPLQMSRSPNLYLIKEDHPQTIREPLTYGSIDGFVHLSPNMQVQSYLLSVAPAPLDFHNLQADVEFEGKILGIIANEDNLNLSDLTFADPRFDYPTAICRGIDFQSNPDAIILDESRHKLRLNLVCFDGWFDQVRVLVEVKND